jgi:hypothetical protein
MGGGVYSYLPSPRVFQVAWAFGNIIHDHWSASLDIWKYSSQPGVLVMKNFFSKAWAI